MSGILKLSVRAVILFAIVLFGLLAFAATKITTGDGLASADGRELVVAAGANLDTPKSVASLPGRQAMETLKDAGGADSESGALFLMILGLSAVAIALRRRRVDRVRHQFA